MFDYRHYVPILRQKAAEMEALRFLTPESKRRMTPLIELPPTLLEMKRRKGLNDTGLFLETAKQIAGNWGQFPFFADLFLIEALFKTPKGKHPLWLLSESARTLRLSLIPVTGLNRPANHQEAVAQVIATDRRGACIRLSEIDLRNPALEKALRRLISLFKLQPKQVDILIDFGLIGVEGMKLSEICYRMPLLSSWRTLTVACGSFPRDLRDFEKNLQHELPRRDWQYWFDQIKNGPVLPRRPSFGDYTIQHPIYYEPIEGGNPSASIRYTADNYWIIMRGEGLRNEGGPGFAQYWANASLLSGRAEFRGPDFSNGDEYIYNIGRQNKLTGTPRTWLRAGINHHITFVMWQIASAFGSSTDGGPGNGSGPGLLPPQASRKSSPGASGARLQPYQVPLIK
jgi:hypothetical protein